MLRSRLPVHLRPRSVQRLLTIGTAVALVATSLVGFLAARESSRILGRAHGEHLLHEVRHEHPVDHPLDAVTARRLIRRLAPEGLRCIAVFDEQFQLVGRYGGCVADDATLTWVASRLPPGEALPVHGILLAAHRPPPPEMLGGTTFPHRWPFVVAYDPVPAHLLNRVATGLLVVGLLGAVLLVGAAVVNDRLTRRAAALDAELARDRHLASLGEMSAVMAHEIRNPLASLKGNAQLLAEQLHGDGPVPARAQLLVRETERLEALCEELLAFARAHRVEVVETDPAALVRDAAASVAPDRIVVDTTDAPPTWRLDPLRMTQALTNLLCNAVRASPPGTAARVVVRRDGGMLVVEVRDSGPGVPLAERERIFEPFHTTSVRGTGLGLAVARRTVELHGGTITVGDAPGGGALFRIRVPKV